MTKQRDLGPPLALAGLAVVVVAVIAGFIAVGGPGDARDLRLDDITTSHVSNVAAAAQCAVTMGDPVPADLAGIRTAIGRVSQNAVEPPVCNVYGSTPVEDDVEYLRLTDDRIRLCANFRRPYDPDDTRPERYIEPRNGAFPELSSPRPAGHHCYEILLIKPGKPAN